MRHPHRPLSMIRPARPTFYMFHSNDRALIVRRWRFVSLSRRMDALDALRAGRRSIVIYTSSPAAAATYCAEGHAWLDRLNAKASPPQPRPFSCLNPAAAFTDALGRYRNAQPNHDAATAARYRAARIRIARSATRWARRSLMNQLGDYHNAFFGRHCGSCRRADAPPIYLYISG